MTTRRTATRISTLAFSLLLCTAAHAQQAPTPASSSPLIDVTSPIRTQSLSS
ncbi:EF-hand domain-containing protein, partial [Xanthomonas oryzae pv. oryzicola]|nr:EF-hand domain-containing protein [Xanthomonas oryzae pv. oryzicola]